MKLYDYYRSWKEEERHKLRLMLPAVEDLQNKVNYLKWHKFVTYIGGL
jgi:hypothetical protein